MRRIIFAVLLLLFSAHMLSISVWSQSTNRTRRKTRPSQRVVSNKKPTVEELASVDSNCSKGVLNDVALHLGFPSYPLQARRKHVSGKVKVKIYINEQGDVYYAVAEEGPVLLRPVAVEAASRGTFAPFKLEGKPIKCSGFLVYTFNPL